MKELKRKPGIKFSMKSHAFGYLGTCSSANKMSTRINPLSMNDAVTGLPCIVNVILKLLAFVILSIIAFLMLF